MPNPVAGSKFEINDQNQFSGLFLLPEMQLYKGSTVFPKIHNGIHNKMGSGLILCDFIHHFNRFCHNYFESLILNPLSFLKSIRSFSTPSKFVVFVIILVSGNAAACHLATTEPDSCAKIL